MRAGLGVILATALVATACTSGSQVPPASDADPNGEITTVMASRPRTLDPQAVSSADGVMGATMVFEGLMTLDRTTRQPIPAAAKAPPTVSTDGLTYTFTLRDGLTYSDGSPLSARDFVYGFSRLCDPAVAPPYASSGYIIVGCAAWNRMDPKRASPADLAAAKSRLGLKANGDKEFVVTLTEPAAYFPSLAAIWVGMPARESDVAATGDRYGYSATAFIGNGPFTLVELTPDRQMVFERNDRYRAPAKLKRWTKIAINDPTVAFAAYKNNEIDFYDVRGDDLPAIERDADLRAQLVDASGPSTAWFSFNTARAPFTDPKVRQAFAKAIDRESYIRDILKIGEPAYSLIPPGTVGHDPGDRFQAFDPAAARLLLQSSAFFGKPELTTIRYAYQSEPPAQREKGEWLQQQLKQNLGIEITVEGVERTLFQQQNSNPATRAHITAQGWAEDYPDPQDWLTITFHSSSALAAIPLSYANPTFDRLVKEADREADPQKRAGLYQQASRILSQDAPAAWLSWGHVKYLQKPWVKGRRAQLTEIYVTKGKK